MVLAIAADPREPSPTPRKRSSARSRQHDHAVVPHRLEERPARRLMIPPSICEDARGGGVLPCGPWLRDIVERCSRGSSSRGAFALTDNARGVVDLFKEP